MIEKISNCVYAETGVRGCNHSFVVTSEGVVMIDTPQFPADAITWRERIAGFGPVLYVINNEPHGDHISGNYFFEGKVVAHEGTREAILAMPAQSYTDMVKQMEPASLPLITNYNFRVPTITFTDKMTLYVGKHSFQLVNFPGHTKSQLAVYIPEEKVLFTSDNVVCGTMPYIMSPALPFEWIESLRRMQQLDVKVVVPGHGEICDKAYLAEMVADIESWINAVSNAIDKGMDLEQIQSKVSMLDRYTRSTTPVERLAQTQRINLASLYERLKGKKEA